MRHLTLTQTLALTYPLQLNSKDKPSHKYFARPPIHAFVLSISLQAHLSGTDRLWPHPLNTPYYHLLSHPLTLPPSSPTHLLLITLSGTSARDGSALAGALLEALERRGVVGVFATHLHELFDLPLGDG